MQLLSLQPYVNGLSKGNSVLLYFIRTIVSLKLHNYSSFCNKFFDRQRRASSPGVLLMLEFTKKKRFFLKVELLSD
jgi:hypothetical protein